MATKPTKSDDKAVRFTTPPFVISYPHLFKAQKGIDKTKEPKFSCVAIWTPAEFGDKDKKLWGKMMKEVTSQIREVFGIKAENRKAAEAALAKKFPKAWIALRDGDEGDYESRAGYGPGKIFTRLATTTPPGVVDLSKTTIHPSEGNADEIYPGAICRATVTIKAYDHKDSGGKGYVLYLSNVQKIKDGPRLDSKVAAEDDFDEEVDGAWLDEADDAGDGDTEEEADFE